MQNTLQQPTRTPARNSRNWIAPILVVLAIGLSWFLGRSSNSAPLEGSPDVTFARDMIAHHTQAVDMAIRVRDRTTDPILKIFAIDIALGQTNQMGQMMAWLDLWNVSQNSLDAPMNGKGLMMGMATQQNVNSISSLPIKDAEIEFLQLMIRHHQGGIFMAQDVLGKASSTQVKRLAQAVINAQNFDIDAMTSMLEKRGAKPLSALPKMQMR
jgi:uncharacterized protein (DUF305 family)